MAITPELVILRPLRILSVLLLYNPQVLLLRPLLLPRNILLLVRDLSQVLLLYHILLQLFYQVLLVLLKHPLSPPQNTLLLVLRDLSWVLPLYHILLPLFYQVLLVLLKALPSFPPLACFFV